MNEAASLRSKLFKDSEPIDPEKALDRLCDLVRDFDWFVGDHFFEGMKDVIAFVKFDDGRHLFLNEQVYEDLCGPSTDKFRRAAFVVAHEIGHVMLHFRSKKAFARNKLGSPENYRSEEKKEKEANLFAGSFMIPTSVIDPALSEFTLSRTYRTSYRVAGMCKREAQLLQKLS